MENKYYNFAIALQSAGCSIFRIYQNASPSAKLISENPLLIP